MLSPKEPHMRFDLKRPCRLCPFANTEHRITFASRERAEEIEEAAYRQGFVCHEHSELVEEDEYNEGGFVFAADGSSQHCWGALAMYLHNSGSGNVPFEWLSEEEQQRWWDRADTDALSIVFEDEEAFLEANT